MSLPAREALHRPGRASELPRATPRTVVFGVTGDHQGLAAIRDFTRRSLNCWALDHCCDDAVAVVTELAANALEHTGPHAPADDTDVWLRLTLRPAHLVCAVTDHSDSPPVYPHTTGLLDERGRGLRMIDALSDHWGWTRRFPTGKTVWAMLPAHPRF